MADKYQVTEIQELKELEDKAKTRKGPKSKGASPAAGQVLKTQAEAARYAGKSGRTVRRWVKAGMPKTEDGHYIKAMLDFYKKNEGNQPTEAKARKEEASADKTQWQAEKLKMEVEIEQGKLVHIDDDYIQDEVKRHMAVNRSLNGLCRTVGARLPVKMRRIVIPILKEEVINIQDAFAEGRPVK